jgi:hypothetical protein
MRRPELLFVLHQEVDMYDTYFLCKGNLDFSSNAQIAISPYSQPPSSSAMSFPTLQSGP